MLQPEKLFLHRRSNGTFSRAVETPAAGAAEEGKSPPSLPPAHLARLIYKTILICKDIRLPLTLLCPQKMAWQKYGEQWQRCSGIYCENAGLYQIFASAKIRETTVSIRPLFYSLLR